MSDTCILAYMFKIDVSNMGTFRLDVGKCYRTFLYLYLPYKHFFTLGGTDIVALLQLLYYAGRTVVLLVAIAVAS